jgi:hypothetical protein
MRPDPPEANLPEPDLPEHDEFDPVELAAEIERARRSAVTSPIEALDGAGPALERPAWDHPAWDGTAPLNRRYDPTAEDQTWDT